MNIELPRLVVLDLYRRAIDSIERLSRKNGDRKIHAWSMQTKKEVGDLMMQVAADEMYGEVEDSEEEKKQKSDKDFYGVSG